MLSRVVRVPTIGMVFRSLRTSPARETASRQ